MLLLQLGHFKRKRSELAINFPPNWFNFDNQNWAPPNDFFYLENWSTTIYPHFPKTSEIKVTYRENFPIWFTKRGEYLANNPSL